MLACNIACVSSSSMIPFVLKPERFHSEKAGILIFRADAVFLRRIDSKLYAHAGS